MPDLGPAAEHQTDKLAAHHVGGSKRPHRPAAEQAGATRIVWLTLYESRESHQTMNGVLTAAAASDSHLILLDWNAYSRSHPDWFQPDGVHTTTDGAIGLATLIHSELVTLGVAQVPSEVSAPGTSTTTTTAANVSPVIVTVSLPEASENQLYSAPLRVNGGAAPYRWIRLEPLAHGILLAVDGLLTGIPRVGPGTFALAVKVTDSKGRHTTRRVLLRVKR